VEFFLTQNSFRRKIKKILFIGGEQGLSVMVRLDRKEAAKWEWNRWARRCLWVRWILNVACISYGEFLIVCLLIRVMHL